MKYNPPYGSSSADAPYINATPGQKGSPVPAEAIEYTQREIVNAIKQSGLTPSNENLGQLYQAMQRAVLGGAYTLPAATASALGGVMVNKGGLQVTTAGLLSVLLASNGGLGMNSSGQLYVSPEAFSTEILNEFLKTLRLQQWLVGNKVWYVRPDGDDSNDGSANTADRAFKTLQHAVNYVSENFNLSAYQGIIEVVDGLYPEHVILPRYNASTGYIIIRGTGVDNVVINGSFNAQGTGLGTYHIRTMTVRYPGTPPSISSVYACFRSSEGTSINLQNVAMELTNTADISRYALLLNGGSITVTEGCSILGTMHNFVYSGASGGKFFLVKDTLFNGTSSSSVVYLRGLSTFATQSALNNNVVPAIYGSVTGRRYTVSENSILNTEGSGDMYIPGTIAGNMSSGGQYT